jgi:hypothetical protein
LFLNVSAQVREIEDNSFLLEEAYNQEFRVVQHILTSDHQRSSSNIVLTFSQEYPFFSEYHQVSYAVPYQSFNSGNNQGIGDIFLSYRYQLTGKESWAATAPMLSLVLPTGSTEKQLGSGSLGYEFILPVSKRISRYLAAHLNTGAIIYPNAKIKSGENEFRKLQDNYFLGAGLIWLSGYSFNFIMEYVFEYNKVFDSQENKSYEAAHIISPGVRAAIDFSNLQVVPGIAVPVDLSNNTTYLFFYLSFEHPF